MLNTYTKLENNNNFNYNINAVSGTIRKSHFKSIITKVKLNDTLLDKVKPRYSITTTQYRDNRYDSYKTSTDYPVIILQVMLCGNDECLVEFVKEEDFKN